MNMPGAIRRLRLRAGLTPKPAAQSTGAASNTSARRERGERNPKPQRWDRTAKVLGISPPALVDVTPLGKGVP